MLSSDFQMCSVAHTHTHTEPGIMCYTIRVPVVGSRHLLCTEHMQAYKCVLIHPMPSHPTPSNIYVFSNRDCVVKTNTKQPPLSWAPSLCCCITPLWSEMVDLLRERNLFHLALIEGAEGPGAVGDQK